MKYIRNLSHYYVIKNVPGLETHVSAFDAPPKDPGLGSIRVSLTIEDPSGQYLPRITVVDLPKNPDTESIDQQNSLFRPQDVIMYSASTAHMNVNWSIIGGSLFYLDAENKKHPVRGALVRVIKTDDEVILSRGLSDERGEITVIVLGIPITNFSSTDENGSTPTSGPVLISETSVRLEIIVAPDLPWPVDPEALELNHSAWLRNINPIGLFAKGNSPYGLNQPCGNVKEWVKAEEKLPEHHYIARGGSWYSDINELRVTYRQYYRPEVRLDDKGVRCAVSK